MLILPAFPGTDTFLSDRFVTCNRAVFPSFLLISAMPEQEMHVCTLRGN